jgi:hypothetical protein
MDTQSAFDSPSGARKPAKLPRPNPRPAARGRMKFDYVKILVHAIVLVASIARACGHELVESVSRMDHHWLLHPVHLTFTQAAVQSTGPSHCTI